MNRKSALDKTTSTELTNWRTANRIVPLNDNMLAGPVGLDGLESAFDTAKRAEGECGRRGNVDSRSISATSARRERNRKCDVRVDDLLAEELSTLHETEFLP